MLRNKLDRFAAGANYVQDYNKKVCGNREKLLLSIQPPFAAIHTEKRNHVKKCKVVICFNYFLNIFCYNKIRYLLCWIRIHIH